MWHKYHSYQGPHTKSLTPHQTPHTIRNLITFSYIVGGNPVIITV